MQAWRPVLNGMRAFIMITKRLWENTLSSSFYKFYSLMDLAHCKKWGAPLWIFALADPVLVERCPEKKSRWHPPLWVFFRPSFRISEFYYHNWVVEGMFNCTSMRQNIIQLRKNHNLFEIYYFPLLHTFKIEQKHFAATTLIVNRVTRFNGWYRIPSRVGGGARLFGPGTRHIPPPSPSKTKTHKLKKVQPRE